jgi:CHAD domain-containing protein
MMKEFAEAALLERFNVVSAALNRARQLPDEEAVHDLRVAIRRLFAAQRMFTPLFPPEEFERRRAFLRPILKLAGEVRNRDIALALSQSAGLNEVTPVVGRLRSERARLSVRLQKVLDENRIAP